MMKYTDEYEKERRKCWTDVFAATASAANCTKSSTCVFFADAALKAFDERFPNSKQEKVHD